MNTTTKKVFMEGMRDGLPIGLGYFAVSFSLGIVARNAGLNAFQGFLARPVDQRICRRICHLYLNCCECDLF